jgi:hydroxymethylglutaryl-CoA reductase (NADPH)
MTPKLPADRQNDYTTELAAQRRDFIQEQTGAALHHVGQFSFDPAVLPGNIERFMGVAQVPIGLAGPLRVYGEWAEGDFYVPMATTEGTLVASYNRGMKLTREAGGIMTTVLDDAMNRAPVFVFENARYSRDFGAWIDANFLVIKAKAEETTSVGKLVNIEQHTVGKLHWLRFNFTTGDAAGQNMVTKAAHRACHWILDQYPPGLEHFSMAANMDTDKKHSHLNMLHTRGKRVVAEVTIPNQLIETQMHTTAEALFRQRQFSNMGALLSHSVNNGAHFANGITAVFIATGQDVANVAESSAGLVYSEIRPNGDYYFSVTIPSLIVATYGGGTALPTQRECLAVLGCFGAGKAHKLAEIVAATVLCGELSLASAIVANEWVSSHEALGRNR